MPLDSRARARGAARVTRRTCAARPASMDRRRRRRCLTAPPPPRYAGSFSRPTTPDPLTIQIKVTMKSGVVLVDSLESVADIVQFNSKLKWKGKNQNY